jgi:D-sedoheptulose 7-phosphate isomerase
MDFIEYTEEQHRVLKSVQLEKMYSLLDEVQKCWAENKTVWIAGNGGSSATASHAVADLTKTVAQLGQKGIRSVALSEMVSLQSALANDISFEQAMGETLKTVASPGDALLVFSVSGRSPNLLAAAALGPSLGVRILSVVGEQGAPLNELSDLCIVLDSSDYQIVENCHLTLLHWLVKQLAISR